MRDLLLRILSLICFSLAAVLFVWSFWQPGRTEATIPIRSGEAIAAGLPEQLNLTYPEGIRLGEVTEFVLSLEGREATGLPSTAQAEARLELTGVDIEPGSRLIQTVSPGRPVTFRWQVKPYEVGISEGMLWFYWTTSANNQEQRLPVLARPVQINVGGFLGWPVWVGQLTGLGLGVVGGILLWVVKQNGGERVKRPSRRGK